MQTQSGIASLKGLIGAIFVFVILHEFIEYWDVYICQNVLTNIKLFLFLFLFFLFSKPAFTKPKLIIWQRGNLLVSSFMIVDIGMQVEVCFFTVYVKLFTNKSIFLCGVIYK